jgi:hypothetical protein
LLQNQQSVLALLLPGVTMMTKETTIMARPVHVAPLRRQWSLVFSVPCLVLFSQIIVPWRQSSSVAICCAASSLQIRQSAE